jgi:hypothetical protein
MPISMARARAAKDAAKRLLADIPGVVGIGVTKVGGEYALKVNLKAALPKGVAVPKRIEGVPVRAEVVGVIRKRGRS